MITHKQWSAFLIKIAFLKSNGFQPYIGDRKVVAIKNTAEEQSIWTSDYQKDETGKMVRVKYTFEESIGPHINLDMLYSRVRLINVSMADVYRGDLREIRDGEASIKFEIAK